MRIFVAYSLLLLLASGCSHVLYLDSMSEEGERVFKDRSSSGNCTVTMKDGTIYKAGSLKVDSTAVSWIDRESGGVVQAKTEEIRQILFVSRSAGAGDGFMIGFLAGAMVGGVIGYLGGEDCSGSSGEICISRGSGTVIFGLLFGIPCGVVGALSGAGRGAKYIYYPSSEDTLDASIRPKHSTVKSLSNQCMQPSYGGVTRPAGHAARHRRRD
jgi:hypothetical protein